MSPEGSVSKTAPSAISLRTRSDPSLTNVRTAASSHSPAPAARVSARCASGVSGSASAAAIPPCAHSVDPLTSTVLVTSSTRPTRRRRRRAAVSPAMPEPTTTTSAVAVQPASGAASRRARTGALVVGTQVPALDPEPRRPHAVAVRHVPGVLAGLHDPVVGVDEDHVRTTVARLGLVGEPVGDHDHDVARVHVVFV